MCYVASKKQKKKKNTTKPNNHDYTVIEKSVEKMA